MAQDSRKGYIERAVDRYSSLFTLPTYRSIVLLTFVLCAFTAIAAVLPIDTSPHGLSVRLCLAALLFAATLLGDRLTANTLLRGDPILNPRRCSFLSLASNLILFVFGSAGVLTSVPLTVPNLWSRITALGVFAALSLRFLILYSVSLAGSWRIFLAALLQPALFLVPQSLIRLSYFGLQDSAFTHFPLAALAAFLAVYLLIASVNAVGIKESGVPSIRMFKAFLVNWTEDLEKPLEEILERLSEEHDIRVSLLAFKTGGRVKAVMVVPSLHPGPFKNVGSSSIPSLIQNALEEKLGCVVSVPHGMSGHELDLASQAQNHKILDRILESPESDTSHPLATKFLQLKEGDATVGCQIFGDQALLTLTLAPKTMEDLPPEINKTVISEAKGRGLASAVVIDAHNSIEGPFNPDIVVVPLEKAARSVLEKATSCERLPFEVGAAKVTPEKFGVEEGMGPGGIVAIVTKVGDQKAAYVTIDGNNMVSNLRERILSDLQELGVDSGEVLTTDTHIVNGVVLVEQGYHPIGEIIDHDQLIRHIRKAVTEASNTLAPAEASWREEEIPGVKVIGERQISRLCLLVEKGVNRAKDSSLLIFPSLGILLAILFLLF